MARRRRSRSRPRRRTFRSHRRGVGKVRHVLPLTLATSAAALPFINDGGGWSAAEAAGQFDLLQSNPGSYVKNVFNELMLGLSTQWPTMVGLGAGAAAASYAGRKLGLRSATKIGKHTTVF